MQIVPLQAIASQSVSIQLNGQNAQINVYQKFWGVYLDVYVNDVLLLAGALCENLNLIVRTAYLGFVGDLAFIDTEGSDDPNYTGLGARWQLAYMAPEDLLPGEW